MECRCTHNSGIVPGETASQNWRLPYPAQFIARVVVTYNQAGEQVLLREFDAAEGGETEGATVTVDLTQTESLSLRDLVPVEVQINALLVSGARAASKIVLLPVGQQTYREEMSV